MQGESRAYPRLIVFNKSKPRNLTVQSTSAEKFCATAVDIPRDQINLLDGTTKTPQQTCDAYEEKVISCRGIDLFLGGIGENGHIAFNESGAGLSSRTRVVTLSESTRIVNVNVTRSKRKYRNRAINLMAYRQARFFDKPEDVPKRALSIGISTLLDAKRISKSTHSSMFRTSSDQCVYPLSIKLSSRLGRRKPQLSLRLSKTESTTFVLPRSFSFIPMSCLRVTMRRYPS